VRKIYVKQLPLLVQKNNYHSYADRKITTLGVKNLNLLQELIIKNYC
jgi:hypothetical protein